jgi:hypothetical protein
MPDHPMLTALWMPILLSGVIVFIASSVIHMMTPWHKNEFPPLPDEEGVRKALRPFAIPPGEYMIPRCLDHKEMRTPEFQEKLKQGPVAIMTVLPNGMMKMAEPLIKWFIYIVVVSIFAAYVASHAVAVGGSYLEVFRFVGATAFAAYAMALWQARIWYHRALATVVRSTIDGLLYACLTAGTFGWLWPR